MTIRWFHQKKIGRYTRTVCAALACASVLSACATSQDAANSGSSTAPSQITITDQSADYLKVPRDEVNQGGTFTTAITELTAEMNTFHANGTLYTKNIWDWYNPHVIDSTPDGTLSWNPDYITDAKDEVVDGKTRVTYTINDKATWNDGTPIDWTAFETTWYISNGKNDDYAPSSTDGYEDIESVVRGATDKEVVVTFDKIYPWWDGLFDPIAHPALKDPANYNDYNKKLHPEWGAGPFTVESIDFNKGEAVFVPNDKWWGNKPKLDKRIFRVMDSQAALNAFKNGEIDATGAGTRDRYAALKDMPGVDIRIGADPSTTLFMLNADSEIFSDIRVRQAVMQGLDRRLISTIAFQGLPYSEDPPGSFIRYPFQEGYRDNFSLAAPYDVDAAKALLDEAGWTVGSDGMREKNGEKLVIRYMQLGESEITVNTARVFQQTMKENLGADVEVTVRPSSDFSKAWAERDYDVFPMGISGSSRNIQYFGQTYLSDSTLNASHTGTPELDEKIRELQALPTQEEQITAGNDLEVEMLQRYGIVPLYNGPEIDAIKKGFANYGALAFATYRPEDIGWVNDDVAAKYADADVTS